MLRKLAAALKTEWVDIVPRTGQADDYLVSRDRNPNTAGAKPDLHRPARRGALPPSAKRSLVRPNQGGHRLGENPLEVRNHHRGTGAAASSARGRRLLSTSNPLANVVLPSLGFAEKRGSMINGKGRLQRLNRAIRGPGLRGTTGKSCAT